MLLLAVSLALPSVAAGRSEAVLWLPASYEKKLAPALRRAAAKLEATERCDRLLRGSLHDSSRGVEKAVFLLVCRDPEGSTYSVLADAKTLEFAYLGSQLSSSVSGSEKARLLEARIAQLQQDCESLFERKTRYMKNLRRIPQEARPAEVNDQGVILLRIPFDAESMQGRLLKYQAVCSAPARVAAKDESPPTFTIKTRKTSPAQKPGS